MSDTIKTPNCPGCDSPPKEFDIPLVPSQAFCPNDNCHVIMWNPTKPLDELAADAHWASMKDLP